MGHITSTKTPSPIASIQRGEATIPEQNVVNAGGYYNGASVTVTISAVNQGRSILSPKQYYSKYIRGDREVMIDGEFVSNTQIKFAGSLTNAPGVQWVVRYEVIEFV